MINKPEEREIEIDLLEILHILLEKAWIIILCAVIAGIGAYGYVKLRVPVKYYSYTTLYVNNNNNTKAREDLEMVSLSELYASQSLVTTYIEILKSDTVMEAIIERLEKKYDINEIAEVFPLTADGKVSTKAVKAALSMEALNETEVLSISARTTSPEMTADICNMLADFAPDFLIDVVGAGSVKVIDPAKVNYYPVEPNVKKFTVLGLLLGFIASAGVIVLVYLIDNSVKSADEIKNRFNKPILSEIYDFAQESGKKSKKNGKREITPKSLINKDTIFTVAESYKTLRSNTIFAIAPYEKKVLAVTSANAAEGKSTTTANLAISFAQTENKVLLIDADMRKPTQHKLFEVKTKTGLSTAISKQNKVEDCIVKNVRENLDFMPVGTIPPNPSELLASAHFKTLIEELSKRYDYIIIDTPPVNVVNDALVIHDSIAGVLFVAKHGSTTYDNITNAVEKLELAELEVLGFILNDITKSHNEKYYRYKYKYKYDYSQYDNNEQ